MPKKPLLFRLRRFFGLCESELFWMKHFLPASDHIMEELLYAVRHGRLTESTFNVCHDFLEGIPLPSRHHDKLSAVTHFTRQQDITDALIAFLER